MPAQCYPPNQTPGSSGCGIWKSDIEKNSHNSCSTLKAEEKVTLGDLKALPTLPQILLVTDSPDAPRGDLNAFSQSQTDAYVQILGRCSFKRRHKKECRSKIIFWQFTPSARTFFNCCFGVPVLPKQFLSSVLIIIIGKMKLCASPSPVGLSFPPQSIGYHIKRAKRHMG